MPTLVMIVLELEDAVPSDVTLEAHSHKCGHSRRGEEGGCGHVFQHVDGSVDHHMCPVCGRGPWTLIWNAE
jgi:hypothetical protein